MSKILLAWDHRHSTNLGDHAVTEGSIALLSAAGLRVFVHTQPATVAIAATRGTVAYGGGEHIYSHEDLARWLEPLLRADRAVVLSSTFGPFDESDHEMVKQALGRHPVAARDPESARMLGEVLGREIPVLLDPAFFIGLPKGRVGKFRILAPRRDDKGMRITKVSDRRPAETRAFRMYRARLRAWPGLLIAHSQHDARLCRDLSDETGAPWFRPTTLRDLLSIYATCSSVYTSRYHGALFARMYGRRLAMRPWDGHGHKWSGVPEADDVPALRDATLDWVRQALA